MQLVLHVCGVVPIMRTEQLAHVSAACGACPDVYLLIWALKPAIISGLSCLEWRLWNWFHKSVFPKVMLCHTNGGRLAFDHSLIWKSGVCRVLNALPMLKERDTYNRLRCLQQVWEALSQHLLPKDFLPCSARTGPVWLKCSGV